MEIDKIATLQLQPEDTLVFKFQHRISEANCERLTTQLKEKFPGVKAIILDEGADLQVLKPSLKWTNQKPTQEGWYWYRRTRNKHTACSIVNVTNAVKLYSNYPGEWYGPIEPPEYP